MFQNNLLLAQLKKKLHAKTPRVEGIVKSTERGFGFLEIDIQKSYFIPPHHMKKVMHGDRILAKIRIEKDREIADPEKLIEPFLKRFVGRIEKKENKLFILPDYPFFKDFIICNSNKNFVENFHDGDWAVAQLIRHRLNGDHIFYAEIIEMITKKNDSKAPWMVTLSRYNLDKESPSADKKDLVFTDTSERTDLTDLDFLTIDNINTKDIDDALFITEDVNKNLCLTVAIADPTSYVKLGSKLDIIASNRAFTNYLPGFNVPMLPRPLSEDVCSLNPHECRPVVACRIVVLKDGSISDNPQFFLGWIKSKYKLSYEEVSDWIEKIGTWKPEAKILEKKILLLHRLCLLRIKWRKTNAILFKDNLEYRFDLSKTGRVLDVIVEKRRIAHKIIEESMILANISAAKFLSTQIGFGIYNTHMGFDHCNAAHVVLFLENYNLKFTVKEITTLQGFCKLRKVLNVLSNSYVDSRIRRLQSFGDISITPGPHFALGLEVYATWTSPIRKYGDMINHRLLKSVILGEEVIKPNEEIKTKIIEQRRRNRIAERDISDWLYVLFLHDSPHRHQIFRAEIIDISRGGMRARLIKNGAGVFIPGIFLHPIREEVIFYPDKGRILIKGVLKYQVSDIISLKIHDVRLETRSIIAKPNFE